ncbi:MAG: glycosyltransferase family 4 protein [Pseudodesulfovibrio sp.]
MPESPVRVLHVANSLGLGGTEKVMQLFAAHLDRTRFLPAVYSPVDGERAALIRAAGVETHIGGDLFGVLGRFNPRIVHLHRAGWPQPDLLQPLIRARTPVVVETNVFGRHDPSSHARIIDRTLFVSRFCLERFERETGIAAEPPRYSFLHNPVDTDSLAADARPDRDFSRPAIARLSRPDPGKWSRLALDILPLLVRDVPGFRCHIVGATPEARAFVHEQGLESAVVFHDPVRTDAEIAAFLDNASLLAHANDTGESFGLAIAEAMACGLPVVTHPAMGDRDNAQLELVEQGVTGLVAASAEEYAGAVRHLLTHPEEARRMGLAGQAKAARLFRAQTVTRQLERIYEELLELKGISR